MSDSYDRRRFLRGEPLRVRLRDAGDTIQRELDAMLDEAPDSSPHTMVCLRRQAMACWFQIQYPACQGSRAAGLQALDQLDDLEACMSVYQPSSDVARINRWAHVRPRRVEKELFALLSLCQRLSRQTGGAFDITAGPLIRAWGIYQRQDRIPTPAELAIARTLVGMHKVILDPEHQTISFCCQGVEINLGAIGKGYALDKIAQHLREAKTPALLSASASSFLAVGQPPWDDAWHIDVVDPAHPAETLATVRLRDNALSTSGNSERFFECDGKRYGHLLDPRTGYPARGVLQATVSAPDAATAEALSTACFVHGPVWTSYYCRQHPEIGALLVGEPTSSSGKTPVWTFGAMDARLHQAKTVALGKGSATP